ncbi:EARP and GARP complex-interacting protein 1 [Brevipalpus obovatus]|uniref:EARP and GARP complex-interacting protein 1 n=1 Tax=Brevipalpus obovatus TaxID=246614 RepID=UPI003D9F007C
MDSITGKELESPLIYGIEHQARALCSQNVSNSSSENSLIRFMVGTQSLQTANQVYLLEFSEEKSTLTKAIFKHDEGEIWHISCSSKNPQLLTTCYSPSSTTRDFKQGSMCSLFELPANFTNPINEEEYTAPLPLKKIRDFRTNTSPVNVRQTSVWQPEDGNQLATFEEKKVLIWDLENPQPVWSSPIEPSAVTSKVSNKMSKISAIRWSPHSNCSVIGIAMGNNVYAKDIRVKPGSSFAWYLSAHGQQVRDLDFNPNAQYYLATCGDDCEYKFWDTRKTDSPAMTLQNHSHWVWSVRYNQFHDQLVLTCSSDSRVILTRITSLASKTLGQLMDEGDSEESNIKSHKNLSDGVVATYEEHEDSVYAAEWSATDPWIFASLSYDGRVVINKVPRREKFSLLF